MRRLRDALAAMVLASDAVLACGGAPGPRAPASAPATTCLARLPPACPGPAPSYASDVAPILERRCASCHAGGGVAADEHDFSHLDVLRAQRSALVDRVTSCSMPPSPAPRLEDADAATLLAWVACGARE